MDTRAVIVVGCNYATLPTSAHSELYSRGLRRDGLLYSLKFGSIPSRRDSTTGTSASLSIFFSDTSPYLGDVAYFRRFCPSPGAINTSLAVAIWVTLPTSYHDPRIPIHDNQKFNTNDGSTLCMRGVILRCVPCKHWRDKLISHFLSRMFYGSLRSIYLSNVSHSTPRDRR